MPTNYHIQIRFTQIESEAIKCKLEKIRECVYLAMESKKICIRNYSQPMLVPLKANGMEIYYMKFTFIFPKEKPYISFSSSQLRIFVWMYNVIVQSFSHTHSNCSESILDSGQVWSSQKGFHFQSDRGKRIIKQKSLILAAFCSVVFSSSRIKYEVKEEQIHQFEFESFRWRTITKIMHIHFFTSFLNIPSTSNDWVQAGTFSPYLTSDQNS